MMGGTASHLCGTGTEASIATVVGEGGGQPGVLGRALRMRLSSTKSIFRWSLYGFCPSEVDTLAHWHTGQQLLVPPGTRNVSMQSRQ